MRYEDLASVPYDYAAVAPVGAILFTAGACPFDGTGTVVSIGDHRAQAEKALDNLLAVLDHHRAGPADLVKTTLYVVGERPNLVAVWDVVASRLAPHRPASTLLGVAALGYQDQLVEIEPSRSCPAPLLPISVLRTDLLIRGAIPPLIGRPKSGRSSGPRSCMDKSRDAA